MSDACRHATDTCVPYAHAFQAGPGFRAEPCFCHSEKMAHGFPGMSPQSVICPNTTARPKQPHVDKYSQQLHVCNATKREEPSEHVPACALKMSQVMQKLSSPTTWAMPSDRFRDSSLKALFFSLTPFLPTSELSGTCADPSPGRFARYTV